MGFYGSNDPTNSVKALKDDRVLRIRLQSHHDQSPPSYNTTTHMQYDKINTHKNTKINTNESRHSEMGPARPNLKSRELRTAHLSAFMTVHNFSTQYSTAQFR